MYTGYEQHTFSELERLAREIENKLAQEILRRIYDEEIPNSDPEDKVFVKYKGEPK